MFINQSYNGGSVLFDDIEFEVVAGPKHVDLANHDLTADIKGTAPGAGEVLGDYQLRIEDTDGDRLVFFGTANGSWQSVGGSLDTATEMTANGVTSNGVFNANSPSFNVAITFDNDVPDTWGTGGTLTADNLVLSNDESEGSGWYAGLYWNDLVIEDSGDPCDDLEASMLLNADVKGDVSGGDYQLRVEAFVVNSTGIDEDFETVTGAGGGMFFDYDDWNSNGATSGYSADWDTGIDGEGAYGGIFGSGVEIYIGGGFSAQGLTTGGNGGGGAGEIKVENIIYGPGDGWYAGFDWKGQQLASTDLSQVTLTADIKGTVTSGGTLGDFELRLEDAQGDRMYFSATANGSWQNVGGALDTATEGPALGGGGDGTFDLDSSSYTVVVSFKNEVDTWKWGGTLAIDNLYLTPAPFNQEIGRVVFDGTSDGSFQTVGGLLSEGNSTFVGDLDEDFETATGTGGVQFLDSNGGGGTDNWDDGIEDENAFAGLFDGAYVVGDGGVTAQACTTCGVSGGGAGQIIVEDIDTNGGGWYAGLNWSGYHPDLSDLDEAYLTADIKGTADTGAGQRLGTYVLRIEDPEHDFLAFEVTADGTFQSVGGALSGATGGSVGGGDGIIDPSASAYTVTVVFTGDSDNWGPGGTLTVDNLFLDGIELSDAESYTVTLSFENAVSTWGTDGILTLDNLMFTHVVNPDGDDDVDLSDFAYFQRCFTGSGGAVASECECADLDIDGDVDLDDYDEFLIAFNGPK